ncbi:MAG: hypothetical protein M3067_06965 [Chloroflexota bacterium]|nr:hypothetical protein [Chloroflexota bacterium]
MPVTIGVGLRFRTEERAEDILERLDGPEATAWGLYVGAPGARLPVTVEDRTLKVVEIARDDPPAAAAAYRSVAVYTGDPPVIRLGWRVDRCETKQTVTVDSLNQGTSLDVRVHAPVTSLCQGAEAGFGLRLKLSGPVAGELLPTLSRTGD